MFHIDSAVYKCDLLSITPDIRVNIDEPKKENIKNADTVVVGTIMVKPTINPKYFREIITKKLIPVYRITKRNGSGLPYGGKIFYKAPDIPCFIKYSETQFFDEYQGNTLKKASAEEVKNYIERYVASDGTCNELLDKLNEIFKRAEEYYEEAAKKNTYSDETQIKSLIKTMRKRQG